MKADREGEKRDFIYRRTLRHRLMDFCFTETQLESSRCYTLTDSMVYCQTQTVNDVFEHLNIFKHIQTVCKSKQHL